MEFFGYQPRVVKSARLGKPAARNHARLLLVTLGSPEEVNALVGEARCLREANDEYV